MKSLVLLLLVFFALTKTNAQVGIGTTTPEAALDIKSTTDGLLIPRVDLSSINNPLPLTAPKTSELVYNNRIISDVTPGYYYWDGGKWVKLSAAVATPSWDILGNSNIDITNIDPNLHNFIGTTNNVDVLFRRLNFPAGRIGAASTSFGVGSALVNTADGTTAFGFRALAANETAVGNTAVGYQALAASTKPNNTAIGYQAGNDIKSANNVAVGFKALTAGAGDDNVAVGANALAVIGGANNVAVGSSALASNGGANNTAVGFQAGKMITTGSNNIVIGSGAQVTSGTDSNQIVIGGAVAATNAFLNAPGGWSISSDKRLKADIKDSELGLNFIKSIRPVSYYRKDDVNKKTEYGFIAQELEKALDKAGATNNGILSKTANGMFAVRYNDFLPMTIKAVQEQQKLIEKLQKANAELVKTNAGLLKSNLAILKRLENLEKKKRE